MNINNLNYTYANVMQQPNQSSFGLFVIAYATDIALNINLKNSKYAVSKMKQHLKICLNQNNSLLFQKFDVCKIFFPKWYIEIV